MLLEQAVCDPPVMLEIEQDGGGQAAGAVNRLFEVIVQPASAEKAAVTFTALPSAGKFVSVTVCGEVPMAKLWPFTSNVPVAGAFV